MIFLLKKHSVRRLNFPYSLVAKTTITQQEVAEYLRNYHTTKESNLFHTNTQTLSVTDLVNQPFSFIANSAIGKILRKIEEKRNFFLTPNDITNGIHPHHAAVTRKMLEILGDDYKVGEGIFVLNETEVQKLNLSKKESRLLKPFYETENIHRFYVDEATNLQIIYTDSKFKNPLEMTQYPKLKKHLDRYVKVITSDNRPYGLHRARQQYFFEGEKILSLRKCGVPTFSYCDFDCYVGAKYNVLQPEGVDLKFLTGLLNSKLIAFWLKHKGKIQGSIYQIDNEPLVNLAICADNNVSKKIAKLVNSIILAKTKNAEANVSKQEEQINGLVYDLYEINENEIKVIENDLINCL